MTDSAPASSNRLSPLKLLGVALTVVSLAFVAYEVAHAEWPSVASLDIARLVAVVVAGTFVYAACVGWLAFLWWRLVRTFHASAFTFATAFRIYGTSQLFKYIPSNVMHFVARHVTGRRHGVTTEVLAVAAVAEIFMLIVAAACVSLLLLPIMQATIMDLGITERDLYVAAGVVGVLFLTAAGGVGLLFLRRRAPSELSGRAVALSLAGCQFGYLIFFLVSGLVGAGILAALPSGNGGVSLGVAVGAISLAWLLGFIVPGAPAGGGIREAVILLLFSSTVGSAYALVVALSYRVVTLAGDALIALAAALIPHRAQVSG